MEFVSKIWSFDLISIVNHDRLTFASEIINVCRLLDVLYISPFNYYKNTWRCYCPASEFRDFGWNDTESCLDLWPVVTRKRDGKSGSCEKIILPLIARRARSFNRDINHGKAAVSRTSQWRTDDAELPSCTL